MTKRTIVVMLAGLNLFFLALMIAGSTSPPAAYAQKGGRAGEFSCVTAKAAGQSYDVVYILDRPGRKLHALFPTAGRGKKFEYAQFRDLDKDFRQ